MRPLLLVVPALIGCAGGDPACEAGDGPTGEWVGDVGVDDIPCFCEGFTERSISGDLSIRGTTVQDGLQDLKDLSCLTRVEGRVTLRRNRQLVDLTGLESLTGVGGDLEISSNWPLASLTGLESLTEVGGDLELSGSDRLIDFVGLDSLETVGGSVVIDNHHDAQHVNLATLAGLESLTSVGGDLDIWANFDLTRLTGLDGLATISGRLYIDGNDALVDVGALYGLTSVGRGVEITNNGALTDDRAWALIGEIDTIGGTVTVEGNCSDETGFQGCADTYP